MSHDDHSPPDREPPDHQRPAGDPDEELPSLTEWLRVLLKDYRREGGRYRALSALASVGLDVERERLSRGPDARAPADEHEVSVPWWIVREITRGVCRFADGKEGRAPPCALGQAFDVEPEEGEPAQVIAELQIPDLLSELEQTLLGASALCTRRVRRDELPDRERQQGRQPPYAGDEHSGGDRLGVIMAVECISAFRRRIGLP